jgi:hypothetical protein
LLLRKSDEESSFSDSPVLLSIKVLIGVLSANAAFIISFAIATKGLLNEVSRRREIMLGIFISSYFKIFLLAMLVCCSFTSHLIPNIEVPNFLSIP